VDVAELHAMVRQLSEGLHTSVRSGMRPPHTHNIYYT
jgi:hypothetical protein